MGKKKRWIVLAGVAVPCLAFWWGYHGERRVMDGAGKPRNPVREVVRRMTTPAHEREGREELEELRQAIGGKRLSARETAALWNIVRVLSEREVKELLEDLLTANQERPVNDLLAQMLCYRWGELVPDLAMERLAEGDQEFSYRLQDCVLAAWADTDPDAMRRWASLAEDSRIKRTVGTLSAREWCRIDAGSALAKARAEFPEAVPAVLSELANRSGKDESARKAFLTALADDEDLLDGRGAWLAHLSRSPGLDAGEVENLASELAAVGADEGKIAYFRDSWARYGKYIEGQRGDLSFEAEPLDEVAANGSAEEKAAYYRSSAMEWPDAAIAWAESRGDGELISGLARSQTDRFLRGGWMPDPDHAFPEQTSLLKHFAAWQRKDPQAVGEWLNTLPSDMATFLQTSTSDHESR